MQVTQTLYISTTTFANCPLQNRGREDNQIQDLCRMKVLSFIVCLILLATSCLSVLPVSEKQSVMTCPLLLQNCRDLFEVVQFGTNPAACPSFFRFCRGCVNVCQLDDARAARECSLNINDVRASGACPT